MTKGAHASLNKLSIRFWQRRWSLALSLIFALVMLFGMVAPLLSSAWQVAFSSHSSSLKEADIRLVALTELGLGLESIEARLPHSIVAVSPILVKESSVFNRELNAQVNVRGVDPKSYLFANTLTKGRFLNSFDVRSIVISKNIAQQLKVSTLDTIALSNSKGFRTYRVVGISEQSDNAVYIPLKEARLVFVSRQNLANWFDLSVSKDASIEEVAKTLRKSFKNEASILSSDKPIRQKQYSSQGLVGFLVILALLSLVASFYLLNTNLNIVKLERQKSLLNLHALGLSKQSLTKHLAFEMLLLSLLALALSLPAIKTLEFLLRALIEAHVFSTFVNNALFSFEPLILAMCLTLVFGLAQFAFSSSFKRIFTLSQSSLDLFSKAWFSGSKQSWSVRLSNALKSLIKFEGRGSYGFLFITFTIIVTLGSLIASYQTSVKSINARITDWDLVLYQRDNLNGTIIPIDTEVLNSLISVEGVKKVSGDTQLSLKQTNFNATLYISDGMHDPSPSLTSLQIERELVVSRSFAQANKLKEQSILTLDTPAGAKRYEIIAIIDDIGAEPNSIYLNRHHYEREWGIQTAEYFAIELESNANEADVAASIQAKFAKQFTLDIVSATEIAETAEAIIDNSFRLSQLLLAMFVLVALMGLLSVSTEKLAGLKRQFLIMQNLGASKFYLMRLFLTEFCTKASLTALLSLISGTLLSIVCVNWLGATGRYRLAFTWQFDTYIALLLSFLSILFIVMQASARTIKRQ